MVITMGIKPMTEEYEIQMKKEEEKKEEL